MYLHSHYFCRQNTKSFTTTATPTENISSTKSSASSPTTTIWTTSIDIKHTSTSTATTTIFTEHDTSGDTIGAEDRNAECKLIYML